MAVTLTNFPVHHNFKYCLLLKCIFEDPPENLASKRVLWPNYLETADIRYIIFHKPTIFAY